MMDVIICSGIDKLYRVALVDDAGGFEALSEHDTPEDAVAAKLLAQAASDDALAQLDKLMKEAA